MKSFLIARSRTAAEESYTPIIALEKFISSLSFLHTTSRCDDEDKQGNNNRQSRLSSFLCCVLLKQQVLAEQETIIRQIRL